VSAIPPWVHIGILDLQVVKRKASPILPSEAPHPFHFAEFGSMTSIVVAPWIGPIHWWRSISMRPWLWRAAGGRFLLRDPGPSTLTRQRFLPATWSGNRLSRHPLEELGVHQGV